MTTLPNATGQVEGTAGIDTLLAMLLKASEPDRKIDGLIWWTIERASAERCYWNAATGMPHALGDVMPAGLGRLAVNSSAPRYTASLESALTLIPPGLFWVLGMGRARPEEPLAGVSIVLPDDQLNPIGEAEGDSLPICICRAALEARAAIARAGGGTK